MLVKIKKLHDEAVVPEYQTDGAAGCDAHAICIGGQLRVDAGQVVMIPIGVSVEIPEGYEMQVRSRSGLASRGVFVANSPGTVDCDFRGEVKVLIYNANEGPIFIKHGDRVAQFVVSPVKQVSWSVEEELGETERGEGGFGHTGV